MLPSQQEHTTRDPVDANAGKDRRELTVIDGGRSTNPDPDPTSPGAAAAAAQEVQGATDAIDVAPWLLLNDEDLATAAAQARVVLRKREDELIPLRDEIRAMEGHLLERMLDAHASALAHPELIVEIKRAKTKDVRIDVLRRLEGLVPAGELAKGLFLYQPDPVWKTNLTSLKPLRKYGDEVAEILDAGIVEIEGPPRLSIEWCKVDDDAKVPF